MFRFHYSFTYRNCVNAFYLAIGFLKHGHLNSLIVRFFTFRYPNINALC